MGCLRGTILASSPSDLRRVVPPLPDRTNPSAPLSAQRWRFQGSQDLPLMTYQQTTVQTFLHLHNLCRLPKGPAPLQHSVKPCNLFCSFAVNISPFID